MRRVFLLLAVVALIVAACGDDDVFSGTTEAGDSTTTIATVTTTTIAQTTLAPTTTEGVTGTVAKGGEKRDPADARSLVLSRQSRTGGVGTVINGDKEVGDDTLEYGDRGSDPLLDVLWDDCAAGDMGACDELYRQSPIGSEYEGFGDTCGGTTEGGAWCETVIDVTDPYLYGVYDECHNGDMAACDTLYLESPAGSHFEWFGYTCGLVSDGSGWCVDLIPDETTTRLDDLYAACEGGDMQACDDLYLESPTGSDYEAFGATCGNRTDGSRWCVDEDLSGISGGDINGYGDDPTLDALWDDCAGGDMTACDALYTESPMGSEYEAFGDTCGNRTPGGTWCVDETIDGGSCSYGDDPALDALWDACAGGDMQACDDLYAQSPAGSECEAFGDTCGNTTPGGEWCVGIPADSTCGDATLDALWDACAGGDMQACDDLFIQSPAGSACEAFGDTCGATTTGGEWCAGAPAGSACGDATLDALWESCAGGDMQACDDLYMQSPAGSACEAFGDTCGNTATGGEWCAGAPADSTCGDPALDTLYSACASGDMQACDDLYMQSPAGSACEAFGDTCGNTASGGTWCTP